MAKSHYSFKKRKKEIARQLKQQQKRQRKHHKTDADIEESSEKLQENGEHEAVEGDLGLPAPG